ncbi:hypothetical protein T07_6217 [Trichinella nelsoni]|uniref:Uncharacterized protein n=1 Tax=Trichinella nelsoni TaxID=6336 RepID=A0A0V0RD30_9BILA|nr:hypothetical protein T07_6217 [Trichinella nelsoni]
MALTTMHVKTHTYVFSNVNGFPSLLARMGPAKSTPTYTKGPIGSVLSGGSPAIRCPNGLAVARRQTIHFHTTSFTALRPLVIQNLLLVAASREAAPRGHAESTVSPLHHHAGETWAPGLLNLNLPDPRLFRLPCLSRRQAKGLLSQLHWQSRVGDEPQAPNCNMYQLSIAAVARNFHDRPKVELHRVGHDQSRFSAFQLHLLWNLSVADLQIWPCTLIQLEPPGS